MFRYADFDRFLRKRYFLIRRSGFYSMLGGVLTSIIALKGLTWEKSANIARQASLDSTSSEVVATIMQETRKVHAEVAAAAAWIAERGAGKSGSWRFAVPLSEVRAREADYLASMERELSDYWKSADYRLAEVHTVARGVSVASALFDAGFNALGEHLSDTNEQIWIAALERELAAKKWRMESKQESALRNIEADLSRAKAARTKRF